MDLNQLYAEFCNKFWIYFLGMEAAQGRKTATFQLWKDRIPAARKAMLQFLNEHGVPDKSPLFWVKDFPEPQPHNLNGARSLPDEPLVRAIYNGIGGIYTRREAELFNMQIKGDFVLWKSILAKNKAPSCRYISTAVLSAGPIRYVRKSQHPALL